jgi:TM2 domain-containing membrane protein YozV
MRSIILSFCAFLSVFTASASYTIDEQKLSTLFDSAVEIANPENHLMVPPDQIENHFQNLNVQSIEDKEAVNRYLLVCMAGGCGWMGMHRWYLGTSNGTKVLYCFTGFWLFYIDFWVIMVDCVIKGNGTVAYQDNSKLFMWK